MVLDEICKLEAKYQDNKAKIFSEVLQCWMDNCSRGDYIHDVCSALEAVGEADLAESLSKKYSHIDGKRMIFLFCKCCDLFKLNDQMRSTQQALLDTEKFECFV